MHLEQQELTKPVDRKVYSDRIIYESGSMPLPKSIGPPRLCDFGEARFGQQWYTGMLQPVPYRAPEVLLGIPWTFSADIWNAALVVWVMLEGRLLFTGIDERGMASTEHQLARFVAVLGAPPRELLTRGDQPLRYFDEEGKWTGAIAVPELSLELLLEALQGKEAEIFLDFMRKMLCWIPEERHTAKQLLLHPWLDTCRSV